MAHANWNLTFADGRAVAASLPFSDGTYGAVAADRGFRGSYRGLEIQGNTLNDT